MVTLSIAIISHERPRTLERMIRSLCKVSINNELEIYISDNSKINKDKIAQICSKYSFLKLYSNEKFSQIDNFINAVSISKGKYICVAHDDDFFMITEKNIEFTIKKLKQESQEKLYYFNSISFSNEKPFYLYRFEGKVTKPYSMSAFPFTLPVYPSLVYPKNSVTQEIMKYQLHNLSCGKYTDITYIESILEYLDYRNEKLPGYYIHITHKNSDSSEIDLNSRLKLIKHTIKKLSLANYPIFLLKTIPHIFKKVYQIIYKNIIKVFYSKLI